MSEELALWLRGTAIEFHKKGFSFSEMKCSQAADTIDRLTRERDEARRALAEWVKPVYDTFKKDLEQGYSTKDKVYAVDMLGRALAQRGDKCKHLHAEYDSGGAYCPDCGAKGTFPGMG